MIPHADPGLLGDPQRSLCTLLLNPQKVVMSPDIALDLLKYHLQILPGRGCVVNQQHRVVVVE